MINKKKIKFYGIFLIVCFILGFFIYFNIQKSKITLENSIFHLNSIYLENKNNKVNYIFEIFSLDSADIGGEGGELLKYFDKNNNSIKIIESGYSGETWLKDFNYYFANTDNFLLEDIFQQFDRTYSSEGDRIQTKNETNKYYFISLKMIRWVDPQGQIVDYNSNKFKQKEQEILNQLNQFLNIINTE